MAQIRLKPTGIVLLLLVLSLISFGLGFGLWSLTGKVNIAPTDSSAGKNACSGADSPKDCGGCGPVKGSTGKSYECEWSGGGCREGNNECGGGGGGDDDGLGGAACYSKPNSGTCNKLGDTTCQAGDSGYLCTCTDVSTANVCKYVWSCNNYNPSKCPTDEVQPIRTNVNIVNGCADWGSNSQYTLYTCPNDPYEDSYDGCQENGKQLSGSKVCQSSFPSNFCGWVQADIGSGDSLKFASWYIPCDDEEPPGEEPPSNICDGGAVTSPGNSANYEVGEVVVFKGYAYDKDGINKNKIAVKVDGVVVGNATATNKSCNGVTDAACTAAAGKPVVEWTYSYTVTEAGAHTFSTSWEDTKGVTGASCQGSRVITSNIQGNPDWEIIKTGASLCVDKTAGAQKAQVDYTITVKNVGDTAGQLSTLVDTQDAKVKNSFIQEDTIVPDANVSGRVISWIVSGAQGTFAPGQSRTYKYSLIVPQSSFGTYINTVVATPDSGEAFQATEVTIVGCDVPVSGLFDSTASKVILGVILIFGSAVYMYTDGRIFDKLDIKNRFLKKKRERFEERVAGK